MYTETQQILTAETRQQAWRWLKQGFGKDPHAALVALANHAAKDSNAPSLLTHLREAQQQMQRLAAGVNMIHDPELQNSLSTSVTELSKCIDQILPECFKMAERDDVTGFEQLHKRYKTAAFALVHDFIHDLRAVFKSS